MNQSSLPVALRKEHDNRLPDGEARTRAEAASTPLERAALYPKVQHRSLVAVCGVLYVQLNAREDASLGVRPLLLPLDGADMPADDAIGGG